MRIETAFHGFHRLDLLFRVLNRQHLCFSFPDSMLRGNRAAKTGRLACKLVQQTTGSGRFGFISVTC